MSDGETVSVSADVVKPPVQHGLWRSYMLIFLPMLLSNVLQAASGTLNGIFVGRMMGVDALAAMSAFSPVFFLFLGLIIGLGDGCHSRRIVFHTADGIFGHATGRAV